MIRSNYAMIIWLVGLDSLRERDADWEDAMCWMKLRES